jgi:hypothetical protein
VSSPDGGGGRLIKVGALVAIVNVSSGLGLGMLCEWWMAQEKYGNVLGSLVTRSPAPVTNDVAAELVALQAKQGQGKLIASACNQQTSLRDRQPV